MRVSESNTSAAKKGPRVPSSAKKFEGLERRTRRGHCSVCNAPVRDQRKVFSFDDAGLQREFDRLCLRCLAAERAFSRTVYLFQGESLRELFTNRESLIARPQDYPSGLKEQGEGFRESLERRQTNPATNAAGLLKDAKVQERRQSNRLHNAS